MILLELIFCLLISEKKNIKKKISYIHYLLKTTNILKYLRYCINYDTFPLKDKEFKSYINQNKKFWANKKNKKNSYKKEIILIENFINHPAYSLSNAVIYKYISKISNEIPVCLIRDGDIKAEILFKSFGINRFIKIKEKSFFQRIFYLWKALKFVRYNDKIDKLYNLKLNKIDLGLSTYDMFIRYTGIPSLTKVNFESIVLLSDSLFAYDFFSKIIKENKITKLIQSETAFSPLNILFQLCLKKNIEVFTRLGTDSFSIRRYNSWNQRYYYRANISQKLFDAVYKNRKSAISQAKKYYSKMRKVGFFGQDLRIRAKLRGKLSVLNKRKFLNKIGWKNEKKIVVFFLNHLIDVNFHSGPRKFLKDNYTWTKFMLNFISKNNQYNWIIKQHPSNSYYRSKDDIDDMINEILINNKNVILFPDNIDPSTLLNLTDLAITSHGTVGIEYLSFGINTIFVDSSFYSNMNFMKRTKSKNEIKKKISYLSNSKPAKHLIDKSNVFLFIRYLLLNIKSNLISNHDTSRQINEKKFWIDNLRLVKKFSFKKDKLFNMFLKQMNLNMRHTIDLSKINLEKKRFDDLSE